ncbi:hypothetical protein PYW08_000989 [Mythimna loreyi]|uniref:Uncharacterized protein n=1 Tax=Mythimna loreyi TaxID=667449 RepID=A0ACC2QZC4_9NEOP|nr:hypothetical protein PYW08_000989 [Mythimna loreyi]
MHVQITFALVLVASISSLQGDGINETARKHYGLSFHSKCIDYVKSFTCMTTCKSIGFRVFRLDFRCKCSCHEIKTTTILPFFKWRTNGTTKTLPSTQSPGLYHIAGTISPPTPETTTVPTTTPAAVVTCEPSKNNDLGNTTAIDDGPNSNNSETTTSISGTESGDGTNKPDDDAGKASDAPGGGDDAPTEPSPEEPAPEEPGD